METRRNADSKSQPKISEAAEKTGVIIRGLQARMSAGKSEAGAQQAEESPEDMENQMREYFERAVSNPMSDASVLNEIRSRVIEGVVDRILREWGWLVEGKSNSLEKEVVERLVSRVLDQLSKQARQPVT